MKITQLFRTVPLDQFKPSSRKSYELLLQALNVILDGVEPEEGSYDSLVDLYNNQPDVLKFALMTFQAISEPFMEKTERLDFQGAWLLDGGRLKDLEPLISVSDGHLDDITGKIIELGAHYPLFYMGFKDPHLSLRATAKLLTCLFHPYGDSYEEVSGWGGQIDRLGLEAFGGVEYGRRKLQPAGKSLIDYFYATDSVQACTDPAELVQDVYNGFLEGLSVDNAFRRTLNVLVYNPHLQRLNEGVPVAQVKRSADKMATSIIAHLGTRMRLNDHERVEMAEFISANLFSPFVQDYEAAGVDRQRLMGISDFTSVLRSPLATTYQGPMGSFCGSSFNNDATGAVAEGLENSGLNVDLDEVFRGNLDQHEYFFSLVQYKGTCKLFEQGFSQLAKSGTLNPDFLTLLRDSVTHIDFKLLSPDAKVGHCAVLIDWFQSSGQNDLYSCVIETMNPAYQLEKDPSLKAPLLDYLTRCDLLDANVLRYAGIGPEVLDELGSRASDRLKEDFLAQDLGL